MIFRSVTLEDFGLYAGRQTVELAPEPGRPLVLVGGSNGAGKTTLLEALTLCLHGRRALGTRVAQQEYERHVRSRFHIGVGGVVAERAAIELAFSHVQSGRVAEYTVTRAWSRNPAGVKESLDIDRDGARVDDLPATARQDFLDGLLPPGVAGLFLFDGEKIQALAEDETGEQLADAVHRLLGLDLVDQLGRDLQRFAAVPAVGEDEELAKERANLQAEVVEIEGRVAALGDLKATAKTRRDQLGARADRQHERFAAEGGALAAERARIEADARKAAVELARLEEELRSHITGLLPFALAPTVAASVATRLASEQAAEEDEILLRRIQAAAPELRARLAAKGGGQTLAALRHALGLKTAKRSSRVHDVTAAERAVLLEQLRRVADETPNAAARLRRELVSALERHERAQSLLAQVPEDAAVAALLGDLQQLEREIGAIDADIAAADAELRDLEYDRTVVERRRRRLSEQLDADDEATRTTALALRTIDVLEEFARETEAARLTQIALETARFFNRLSRKGELLSEVMIEPGTFRVSVKRWDGSELPKERLSAGERQLLAVAVLWALAKASGRDLPVVVDTPLARLDQAHRQRLLEQYFPHVSHQVVVLSTDSEVDAAAAAALDPVCARKVWLNHDVASGATVIEAGYFRPGGETAHAR